MSGILNDYVAYPPVVEEDFNQLETFSFLHSPGFDPKGRWRSDKTESHQLRERERKREAGKWFLLGAVLLKSPLLILQV